jgi:hypothetical protein
MSLMLAKNHKQPVKQSLCGMWQLRRRTGVNRLQSAVEMPVVSNHRLAAPPIHP